MTDLEHSLWHALGLIYRDRLQAVLGDLAKIAQAA